MYIKDQDSKQANDLYKQDQGLNQYHQDRDWEEQIELLSDRYFYKRKDITELFDIDTTEITVRVLNDLAEINLNRILSYELAAYELNNEDADLKILFCILMGDSYEYLDELSEAIAITRHELTQGSSDSGKIYRKWLDRSADIAINRRKAVIATCEVMEAATLKAYDLVIKDHDIPFDLRELALAQRESIEMSYHKISELRQLQQLKESSLSMDIISKNPVELRTSA